MLDRADHELGRLFAALEDLGVRDNTLVLVVSDNGASQDGLQDGVTNTDRYRNFKPETVEEMARHLDEIGGPGTDSLYPMGWSLAGNTPFKMWKQDTHLGGNTDRFIVSWPTHIKDKAALQHYLGDHDPRDPLVSPIHAMDHRGLPPAFIVTADCDLLRNDGARYAECLRAAGIAARYVNYPDMPHGFLSTPKLCGGAPGALADIVDEMRPHLQP